MENVKTVYARVSPDIHTEARIKAMRQGMSLCDYVAGLINNDLEKERNVSENCDNKK